MTQSAKIKELATQHIRIDGGTQNRCEINDDAVSEYAEAIKDGATFPPVIVFYDGSNNWLADGFHRWHAANQAGIKRLSCEVRTGSRRDAILFSLGVNATHGLRRTNKDKRKAVETALNDEEWAQWSDSEIARRCMVTDKTVARIRKELTSEFPKSNERIGGDGRTINTAKIGTNRPPKPQPEPPQEPEPPLPEPPQWDDENDVDPYADMDDDPFREDDVAEETDGYGRPIKPQGPVDELQKAVEDAEVIYDNSADFTPEEDMADDEWLENLPVYRVLKQKQHKAIFLREDLLALRVLWPQIDKFKYHAVRAFGKGEIRNTPAARVVADMQTLPHPRDWQVCGPCRGNGCLKCNHSGYHINGAGISPLKVEKGEIEL